MNNQTVYFAEIKKFYCWIINNSSKKKNDLGVFIIKGHRLPVLNELPKIMLIVLLIYCLFKVLKLAKEQTTCISHG